MSLRGPDQGVVLRERNSPQIKRGCVYIAISEEQLRSAGADPHDPETIPETIVVDYHKGGQHDGTVEIPLADAVAAMEEEEEDDGE